MASPPNTPPHRVMHTEWTLSSPVHESIPTTPRPASAISGNTARRSRFDETMGPTRVGTSQSSGAAPTLAQVHKAMPHFGRMFATVYQERGITWLGDLCLVPISHEAAQWELGLNSRDAGVQTEPTSPEPAAEASSPPSPAEDTPELDSAADTTQTDLSPPISADEAPSNFHPAEAAPGLYPRQNAVQREPPRPAPVHEAPSHSEPSEVTPDSPIDLPASVEEPSSPVDIPASVEEPSSPIGIPASVEESSSPIDVAASVEDFHLPPVPSPPWSTESESTISVPSRQQTPTPQPSTLDHLVIYNSFPTRSFKVDAYAAQALTNIRVEAGDGLPLLWPVDTIPAVALPDLREANDVLHECSYNDTQFEEFSMPRDQFACHFARCLLQWARVMHYDSFGEDGAPISLRWMGDGVEEDDLD